MKFTISQQDLLEGLQNVIGVVPVKSPTPALENVLFELDDDGLKMTGTDLEVSVTTRVKPASVDEPGAVALPAKKITEMIRALPNIPIQFESDAGHKVGITTDQGFYKVSGISKDNYPDAAGAAGDQTVVLDNEKLHRMFSKTIFAVSSDELRPALMGVFLQMVGDELRMVATDGHRLSKIVDHNFSPGSSPVKMIVPPKAVQIALKHLVEEGTTELRMDERGLSLSFGPTTLYTRLVEGQYPDYERVIPRDNEKILIVNRQLLMASVKRVSLFSSSITHQVRFRVSQNQLEVMSEDMDMGGEAREKLAVEYNEEPMEIGYNAQYMMDLLRNIDTEEVKFLLKSPISAALITPTEQMDQEDFLMLIMPIKLNS